MNLLCKFVKKNAFVVVHDICSIESLYSPTKSEINKERFKAKNECCKTKK